MAMMSYGLRRVLATLIGMASRAEVAEKDPKISLQMSQSLRAKTRAGNERSGSEPYMERG